MATRSDNQPTSCEEMTGLALGGFVRSPMYTQNPVGVRLYMLNAVGVRALIVGETGLLRAAGFAARDLGSGNAGRSPDDRCHQRPARHAGGQLGRVSDTAWSATAATLLQGLGRTERLA